MEVIKLSEKLEPLSHEEWEEMVRLGFKREREPITQDESERLSYLLEREGANLPDLSAGLDLGLVLYGLLGLSRKGEQS